MTPQELLEDTIAYYSVNPAERRCKAIIGSCHYSPKTANKPTSDGCAIGRHLSDEVKEKFDFRGGSIYFIKKYALELFALAPQWMQDMDIDFLRNIQGLHDVSDFWNETGLSQEGKECVEQIKNKFGFYFK